MRRFKTAAKSGGHGRKRSHLFGRPSRYIVGYADEDTRDYQPEMDPIFARKPLYRSRDGKMLGVCKGFAEYFGVGTKWVRLLVIIVAFASGIWPALGLYILAGLIMKPKPALPMADVHEEAFYASYVSSRKSTLAALKEQFDRLDRRIGHMEDTVTSRDFEWERRLEQRS